MRLRGLLVVVAFIAVFFGVAVEASADGLVMGLIPAEDNAKMIQRFEPMRAYLEKKLGMGVKVFTATDYASVIKAMGEKRVDIAWFGPLSYILAEQDAGAVAFAVGVGADGKSTYRSIFMVHGDSTIKTLKDLEGKSAAFADPASTSGTLVPMYLVKKETGKTADKFFSNITYAGSHDAVMLAVKGKIVDAGTANDIAYNAMIKKGQITVKTNRILLASDPIAGSPLTYRKDIDETLKTKIKDIILHAHNDIKVTGFGELIRYESATPEDYQFIRDMIKELGLTKDQLLK